MAIDGHWDVKLPFAPKWISDGLNERSEQFKTTSLKEEGHVWAGGGHFRL